MISEAAKRKRDELCRKYFQSGDGLSDFGSWDEREAYIGGFNSGYEIGCSDTKHEYGYKHNDCEDVIESLEAQVKMLEECVRFYASVRTWDRFENEDIPFDDDELRSQGKRARDALQKLESRRSGKCNL